MLKHIENLLIFKLGIHYAHHVWSEKAAQQMLDGIEEAGMRPPYNSSQDDEVDTFEWEPENEK